MTTKKRRTSARRASPDVRRAALIEATLVCLRKYGEDGVSVRRISEEAGVSVGLINHYFPEKASLLATAYEKLALSLLQSYREQIGQETLKPRERLRHFFGGWFAPEMLATKMFKIWLVFWKGASTGKEVRSIYKQIYTEHRMALEILLNELSLSPGAKPFDARRAAIGLLGLLDGLWLQICINPHALTPAEAIRACDDWVDGLRSTVAPPPSAAKTRRAPTSRSGDRR